MGFADDVRRFELKVPTTVQAAFDGICEEAFRSIVEGSALTGAPGQPVGQYGPGYHPGKVGGTLKASWQRVRETRFREVQGSGGAAAAYNHIIEYNLRGANLRSTVGGFHSVALTVAGFPRIVEAVAATVPK